MSQQQIHLQLFAAALSGWIVRGGESPSLHEIAISRGISDSELIALMAQNQADAALVAFNERWGKE